MVVMRKLLIVLALWGGGVPDLNAHQFGPKTEPAAMSQNYNPLMWRGDDAQFALNIALAVQCQALISKRGAATSTTPDVQALADGAERSATEMSKQLRSMAETVGFRMPSRKDQTGCEEAAKLTSASGATLAKGYTAYLQASYSATLNNLRDEIDRPNAPGNTTLRRFAKKALPSVEQNRTRLIAVLGGLK